MRRRVTVKKDQWILSLSGLQEILNWGTKGNEHKMHEEKENA